MASRAYWKGYLKLSLVSCPIALFPATSEREKIQAPSKRIEGQREMLLPIPGKKDKEAATKSTVRPSSRHRKTG